MSSIFQNPFRPGAGHPPPYLAGRGDERKEFEKLLDQEVVLQNLVLTGLRGVGKTVLLSGHTFTVVGIAPAAFHSVDQILYCQFWVPLGVVRDLVPNLPPQNSRDYHWVAAIARLVRLSPALIGGRRRASSSSASSSWPS